MVLDLDALNMDGDGVELIEMEKECLKSEVLDAIRLLMIIVKPV